MTGKRDILLPRRRAGGRKGSTAFLTTSLTESEEVEVKAIAPFSDFPVKDAGRKKSSGPGALFGIPGYGVVSPPRKGGSGSSGAAFPKAFPRWEHALINPAQAGDETSAKSCIRIPEKKA
ncbi:hypothetical protein AB0K18_05120 [Nonomuraea sp. NPDC049421]|uniref:hypothetical protein n=1 Tax=Nonomuraea sp. NPDC049421 TaxID=3155275 RepID=UPI0034388068